MLKKPWDFLPLRAFLAGAVAQIGTIAFAYLSYKSTLDKGDTYAEFSAGISLTAAYLLMSLILPVAVGWAMRLPKFLRTGSIVGVAQVASAFMLMSDVSSSPQFLASICIIAGFIMLITQFAGSLADKRLSPVVAYIVAAILIIGPSTGLAWWAGAKLEKANAAAEEARSQVHINKMLSTLDFPIYLPQTAPAGYKLERIAPTQEDDISILKAPNKLTFFYGQNSGVSRSLEIYELKAPPAFNPPKDCGPYKAETLLVGPSSVPVPCRAIARSGQTVVYESVSPGSGPFEYSFYFLIGPTEFAIDSHGTKFDPSDMVNLITGLKPAASGDLPAALLSEN